VPRARSTWPWLLAAALVGAAGGAVALYEYHLPPFSPPPRPIVEPPPLVRAPSPTASAPAVAVAPSPEPPEPAKASPPPVEVKAPEKVPPVAPKETAPPPEDKRDDKRDKEVDKLLQKGRLLMVNGHAHSALDVFRHAQKLKPKDASLRVYEQQALGKLGHAELQLEGKGSAVVDGKKFPVPHKLKLAAGPHTIDTGDGESELVLKRGEKRKLRVKK